MVQRSPRLSTRRMVSRIGVSRMQVWRTLHEDLYPYHDQTVHLEPGHHAQRIDLCHCIQAHPELLGDSSYVSTPLWLTMHVMYSAWNP